MSRLYKVSLLVSGCVVLLAASLVAAQEDSRPGFTVPIPREEFARCIQALDVQDEVQKAVLWTLYEGLLLQLDRALQEYKEELAKAAAAAKAYSAANPDVVDPWAQEGQDFGVIEANLKFLARRQEIRQRLEADVVAALDDWQAAIWSTVQLRLRRQQLRGDLNRHRHMPSTFDLVELLDSLELSDFEQLSVSAIIDEYVIALDEALTDWETERLRLVAERYANSTSARDRATGGPRLKAKQAMGRRVALRRRGLIEAVQSTNLAFAERIASKLGENIRRVLQDAIDRDDYPLVFTPSPVESAIQALYDYKDLHTSKRELVENIELEFMQRERELRSELAEVNRTRDSWKELARFAARREQLVAEGLSFNELADALFKDDPRTSSLQKRREHSIETTTQLRDVFTPIEFDALPVHIRLLLSW